MSGDGFQAYISYKKYDICMCIHHQTQSVHLLLMIQQQRQQQILPEIQQAIQPKTQPLIQQEFHQGTNKGTNVSKIIINIMQLRLIQMRQI